MKLPTSAIRRKAGRDPGVSLTPHANGPAASGADDATLHLAEAAVRRVLPHLSPQIHSSILMALSMAMHFFGYEFARSSNLSMFTSKTSGFSGPGAFPLAMACVSPFSVVLLLGYGRELERNGPRLALRRTTLFCAGTILLTAALLSALNRWGTINPALRVQAPVLGELTPSRLAVWLSFVFQNSYAHLLYAQQWSFIGSVLTQEEGATYFASFAGLSSISSTVAGTALAGLVDLVGLTGLMVGASISLVVTAALADAAYDLSERGGFDPADETKAKKQKLRKGEGDEGDKAGMIRKAIDLFGRVPVLGALFWEVISFQSLSTILNVCFVTKLKDAVADDSTRAAWMGQFYALVNGVSGLLQFGILPLFMKKVKTNWVWRIMPLAPLLCTLIQCAQIDPSLYLVAFSFFAAKVMDYSLRNVVNEQVYVPLDFDSRYLGKEIIGVFGNRFGKSGMSLLLSGLTYVFGNFGIRELSQLTALASASWFACAYRLSNLAPEQRKEGTGGNKDVGLNDGRGSREAKQRADDVRSSGEAGKGVASRRGLRGKMLAKKKI